MTTDDFEGVEIPDDVLEAITGGYMSDYTKSLFKDMCAKAKRNGNDKEHYKLWLHHFRKPGMPFIKSEIDDYVDEIWDSL